MCITKEILLLFISSINDAKIMPVFFDHWFAVWVYGYVHALLSPSFALDPLIIRLLSVESRLLALEAPSALSLWKFI
jgi:hypothetical protein